MEQRDYRTLAEAESELEDLRSELARRQVNKRTAQERRKQAEDEVSRLMEQARKGELANPKQLAEAIRFQAEIEKEPVLEVEPIQAQISTLEADLYKIRLRDAKRAYLDAVMDYARECSRLPALAKRIRDLAEPAHVALTPSNSPHLVGHSVTIGGAVIDIPEE